MSRKLTFSDAVRLLSGETDEIGWLNRLAGLAAAVVTVTTVGAIDLFALRDEIFRWGNTAVTELRARTRGLGRFDRTQLLVAAHSIVVVTSFYEALEELAAENPKLDLARAELTSEEQVALATEGPAAQRYAEMVASLVDAPPPIPAPHLPFEEALRELEEYYRTVVGRLYVFLTGLNAFEGTSFGTAARRISSRLPSVAVDRYTAAYRALAIQAPEFGVWSGMVEGQATRAAVAEAVVILQSELASLREDGYITVDGVRSGLGRRYQARLTRSILSSSDAPPYVSVPMLADAYIEPNGLVAVAGPTDMPATEAWWRGKHRVADVPQFLFGHLTSPVALGQPIVILGQPGSGKSVLTEVLAAELPENEFLAVRVELRKVNADSSVQQQIELSIYQMLGEEVSWPDLVRRAAPALPVVMMDGFDELLQVTGVNRADYLEQLREFQQREAELERPVAILVTSRTVVADRARFPHGTVVVRLEPFDEQQITTWLDVWNTANRASLRQRGLSPLSAATVVRYRELATQPLLLLLLALYDAGSNALQRAQAQIGHVDLYERLFADFVAREVSKHDGGRSGEQRQKEIDAEWRRLGAVAISMLNRGGDVISEADLESDIAHLLMPDDLTSTRSGSMRQTLTVGQLLVGRFFFIHESQVQRGTGASERSFEFLHATFGEFLAARQIVSGLTELAEDRTHARRRPGAVLDAGFLYSLTSFITIARRAPLWEFCQGFLQRLDQPQRQQCRQLMIALLRDAGFPHPTWSLAGYEPRRMPVAARHATYSANLVCLAVLLSDGAVDVVELVGEPEIAKWRAQALLWQSQLDPEDRERLWQTLRVAWDLEADPTVLCVRVEDGSRVRAYESLPWPPDSRPSTTFMSAITDVGMPSDSGVGRALRRSALVQTAHDVREHLYALLPYWRICGSTIVSVDSQSLTSNAGMLFELLLNPMRSRDDAIDRRRLYATALRDEGREYRKLVLAQLARDAPYLYVEDVEELAAIPRWSNLDEDMHDEPVFGAEEEALIMTARLLSRATQDAHSTQEIRDALRDEFRQITSPDDSFDVLIERLSRVIEEVPLSRSWRGSVGRSTRL